MSELQEGARGMDVLVDCGRTASCDNAFFDRFGDYDQDGSERVTFAMLSTYAC
jgi:hypothetical protein